MVIASMELDFSIIIPTRNRPTQIAACLQAVAGLEYPRDRYEVIVVDDGSVPPVTVNGATVVRQDPAGPAVARNTGAAHARGKYLAFTDDDCAPAADWLRTLAARLAERPDHLIGGAVANALPANPYSTASQLLAGYLYAHYNADPDQPRFFTSNNMAVAATAFRAVGGFDSRLPRAAAEDRELCDRWRHLGRPMTYAPEAQIRHAHRLTARTFWQQHFNYGRGAHYFHKTRARRGDGRIRVEPGTFYWRLVRYPWTARHPQPCRQAALLLVSQVANALGFFWERGARW